MAWEKPSGAADLIIGVPHIGQVPTEFALNFHQLQIPYRYLINFVRGSPLDLARNMIVETMFNLNANYVFFLDSDMCIPSDTLMRLMSHKLPIVSALYYKRHLPTEQEGVLFERGQIVPIIKTIPAMWKLVPDPKRGAKYTPILDFERGRLIEADVVGMGCCLVHRRVFEKVQEMRDPEIPPMRCWFRWTQGWEHPDKPEEIGVSEDFYGCERMTEAGYKIVVDTSLLAHHYSDVKFGMDGRVFFPSC